MTQARWTKEALARLPPITQMDRRLIVMERAEQHARQLYVTGQRRSFLVTLHCVNQAMEDTK